MHVWAPAASGPPGLHTTTRELQTCTFEGPGLQKHHQNSTRRPPEREEKNEFCGGRGTKKREIFGPPPFGAPTLRTPLLLVWVPLGAPPFSTLLAHTIGAPTPLDPPPRPPPTDHPRQLNTKKKNLNIYFQKTQTINSQKTKSLHTTKTLTLAKVGLAKVGHTIKTLTLAKVGLAKVGFDRWWWVVVVGGGGLLLWWVVVVVGCCCGGLLLLWWIVVVVVGCCCGGLLLFWWVVDGWMEVGWVGSPSHIIAHTMCTLGLKRHRSVFSFVYLSCSFECSLRNGFYGMRQSSLCTVWWTRWDLRDGTKRTARLYETRTWWRMTMRPQERWMVSRS